MTLNQFKKKVASKKFIGFLLILSSANLMLFLGKIEAQHWVSILTIVTPLYFASDVAQKWVGNEPKGIKDA